MKHQSHDRNALLDNGTGHDIDTVLQLGGRFFDQTAFFFGTADGSVAVVQHRRHYGRRHAAALGWHVPLDSPLYQKFLSALLPELCAFLRKNGLAGKVFFHISDEPALCCIEVYQMASALVHQYLPEEDFPIMDALFNVSFYQKKLLTLPVPAINHYPAFEQEKLRVRWLYYAGDVAGYTGRSFRNRMLGVLLYLYHIDGFLHWGHNFWFGQFSLDQDLDPWADTTCGRAFCSGGAFNVYPGKDGTVVDSLHYEIFTLALQDLRLLQTQEKRIGRDAVVSRSTSGWITGSR